MTEIPNPYLELRQGSKVVGRFEVQAGGEVVAGRTGQCPIVVDHASVSRMHARIFRDSHGVYLEDLGSANGTFLNGEPVTKPTTLADGVTIQLGQKTVRDPVLLIYHDPASRLLRQMGLLPGPPASTGPPGAPTHPANLPATTPTPTIDRAPEKPPERPAQRPAAARPAPPAGSTTLADDVADEPIDSVVEIVPPRPASSSTARLVIVLAILGLAFFGGLLFFATRFLKPASTLWNTVQVTPAQVAAGSLLSLQSPDIQPPTTSRQCSAANRSTRSTSPRVDSKRDCRA
jgi:predicted component of type VI protein secretion system